MEQLPIRFEENDDRAVGASMPDEDDDAHQMIPFLANLDAEDWEDESAYERNP